MQLHDLWQVQELTAEGKHKKKDDKKPPQSTDEEKTLTSFIRWLLPKWEEFNVLFRPHGTMDFHTFEVFVRWEGRYNGDARAIFNYLDRDNTGHVQFRAFLELKRAYESNLKLLHQGLGGLKRLMIGRYGTLARCWRCVFDKEDSGKCCEKTFIKCVREHGFTGDVKSTWAELSGGDPQRQITMKDWDPETDSLLTAFCKLLAQRHGKLREGWSAILRHGYGKAGRLSTQEWSDVCRGLGFTTKDAKAMFSCLDADQSRSITEDEFMFIRNWDSSTKSEREPKKKDSKTLSPMGQTQRRSVGQETRSAKPSASSSSPSSRRRLAANSGDDGYEAWANGGSNFNSPRSGHTAGAVISTAGAENLSPSSGLDGGGNTSFEFVVVLSKAEYSEYLRRRREKQISVKSTNGDGHLPCGPPSGGGGGTGGPAVNGGGGAGGGGGGNVASAPHSRKPSNLAPSMASMAHLKPSWQSTGSTAGDCNAGGDVPFDLGGGG